MKRAHLFAFQIAFTMLCYFCIGNVFAQNKVKQSLFLAGNTASQQSQQYNQFISELTKLNHPYSFIYLGNFASFNQVDKELDFSFYPENIQNNEVPLLFAMGPNEWKTGKKHVKKVVNALRDKFKENPVYTTDWGCPGPTEIEIDEQVTVILIDTYWWLNTDDVRFGKCGIEEEKDVFVWLQDALRRNENKTVIVAGHHPIKSYGPHGGSLPLLVDIFGFPYSIYRNTIGSRSDLSHPDYKNLAEQLKINLNQFPNIIYASAHDNNMQYFQFDGIHQIISGSLQKQAYVNTNKTEFGSSQAGISRLDIHENGDVILHFFTVENGPQNPVFTKKLFNKKVKIEEEILLGREELFKEPTHKTFASQQYLATEKKEKWMGKNYRDIWATPIEARVFDITKEHGGLTILKRGGGQQTKSVRMETTDGRQYVLRSLEKFAEGAIPEEAKKTFAKDVVQDQISAANPYSAMPAAVLAEHAGVFHTNPEVVFVPPDSRFKQFKEDMESGLFLYEERPAGDRRDVRSFGYSKKIVSTDDVLEKTMESEDHQVDQYAVLRARLLDIYINDWDRHDDQWRWASFKENGITVYRPIPRDRDQTFFVNQGILPGIASKDFILPKLQNFQPRTENVIGLGFNARYFDRTFLTQMQWQDWSDVTDSLMELMTEEAIDEAMATFPIEVQPLCADTTKSILLARKEYMKEMANELYLFLSKKVTVTGTNGKNLFEIDRKNNQETEVSVWHVKKDGSKGKQIFNRTFYTLETKEIICYGLNGKDRFEITGNVDNGPIVRIVGGQDKDVVIDNSRVKGIRKLNKVYDLQKSTVIKGGKESEKILSNNKIVHEYDRKSFKNDVGMPIATLGYNADDGVSIGYGRMLYYQKFRRDIKTGIFADYAIKNSAFNVKYKFESLSTNNGLDYIFGADVSGPNYTTNYYGLGNNTKNTYEDKDYKYFQTKQKRYLAAFGVQKRFGKSVWVRYEDDNIIKEYPENEHKIFFGLKWRLMDTQYLVDKFITNFEENELTEEDLGRKQYLILNANYQYKNINKVYRPSRGFVFNANANQFINIQGNEPNFTKVGGSMVTYLSFNKYSRTVFAFRLGGEKIFGDYYFHDAAILDGKTNLRGFRETRFYGNGSVYFNGEVRFKLYDFDNHLLTGEIGLLVFDDIGRVWYENEESNKWHNGFGAGVWFAPFKMVTLTTTLNYSNEETLVQLKFNYLF
jgi:hypothetical protein